MHLQTKSSLLRINCFEMRRKKVEWRHLRRIMALLEHGVEEALIVVATRDEQEVTTASESILARAAEDIEKKEARGMRLTNISRLTEKRKTVQR